MKHHRSIVTGLAAAAVFSMAYKDVLAVTINFDDAYADLGENSNPATYYQADLGVTFTGQYFGVVGGQGNGDPGNWELRGTNGSALLGINNNFSGSPTINFDKDMSGFSVDVGVMAGDFDHILLPSLGSGLSFDVSSLSINGTIAVVPEPGTAAVLGLSGLWAMARRRRDA